MRIKEVSERYGLSPDTLRYYEKVGMIPPVTRDENGLRDYSERDLHWVEVSKCMRAVGVPVEVIAEHVQRDQNGMVTLQDHIDLLEDQRRALLAQREQLDAMLARLDGKIKRHKEKLKQQEESNHAE